MSYVERVKIPSVPFGPDGDPRAIDAVYYRDAARNIRYAAAQGNTFAGSNLTEAVAQLCEAAAIALEAGSSDAETNCHSCGEARAQERASITERMRQLATARDDYRDPEVLAEAAAVRLMADIIDGTNDGAGWLPSWRWDEFGVAPDPDAGGSR